MSRDPRVLHVLPHPGGGGETYVDHLSLMEGYCFKRTYIVRSHAPTTRALHGSLLAQLAARRYDLVHIHGEVASALCLPTLARRPSVVTIHGLHLVRRLDGWRRSVAERSLRLVVRAASATICVGEAELEDVRAVVRNPTKLVLVRNGVEPAPLPDPEERAAVRAELGLRPEDVAGVYLAALDPHKGPLVAARAALALARQNVPLVLLFAGDGPLRAQLEALAGESRSVRVLGFRNDGARVLSASDFFILPSRREGLSFSLLEAMSVGLPAVVSDAPGNAEAVGEGGIVVPVGRVDALEHALRRLVLDARERMRLGEQARIQVARRFNSADMVRSTREVYDRVLIDRA